MGKIARHFDKLLSLSSSSFPLLSLPSFNEYWECSMCLKNKMLLKIENTLLRSHRQRETTGIKKLYNSFFVLF
ncbi:uncharacterized protein LOC133334939 [Musca vetustissima]|uniref:uncharacterized protein LOC133334939 n=1 Tax=Musca vetustissima TaxID=27455 RepID=UPI002AB72854|nr:uncharacterized protein LOC133334939 [Musca vetustissima]